MATKIILFEYMTSGGLCQQPMPSLAREGELMLETMGQGLTRIDDISLLTLRDARLPPPDFDTEVVWVGQNDDFSLFLFDALDDADAFWPVAPETAGTLATLCRLAESKGCLLLNAPAAIVEQAASKLATYRHLSDHAIAAVETMPFDAHRFPCAINTVVKPDDGVGCTQTFLVPAGEVPTHDAAAQSVCQPLVKGVPGSISVVYAHEAMCVLSVNRQRVVIDNAGQFELRSCEVNALSDMMPQAKVLAADIHRAMPDLVAYVGIDFIATDDGLLVLEINPRVTTSLAGIEQSVGSNPCGLIYDAVRGKELKCPEGKRVVELAFDDDR